MSRGLRKLTAVANTLQAWEDYQALACRAVDSGWDDLVSATEPPPQAGWRTIDKAIAELRTKVARRQQLMLEEERVQNPA